MWIAEDIQEITHGVEGGSWIDPALGSVSAGLDALAPVADPPGGLMRLHRGDESGWAMTAASSA
jgi:hypothetical protein